MRIIALGFAACLAACGAAPAQSGSKLDCAWKETPGAEARFTGGPEIAPEAMVHAMQACGIALTSENARRLGLFYSLHHKLGVAAASLEPAYPGVLSKLDAAASQLTAGERAEMLHLGEKRSISKALMIRLAELTTSAGIPLSDERARPSAQLYIIARVVIAELETQV
jgi:hypothetical protein